MNKISPLLVRHGSWLISQGQGRWQMQSVEGPLPLHTNFSGNDAEKDRQIFRIVTSTRDVLFVSRAQGEKGMRELKLEQIFPAKSA